MRSPLPALALLVGSLLLAACGSGSSDERGDDPAPDPEPQVVTLEIATQDWSGWSEEPPGDPEVVTVDLEEGGSTTVGVLIGDLEITVVAITDDAIELTTNEAMWTGGAYSAGDEATEFTLDRGGEVEMTTPTYDAGTTVAITDVS